MPEENIDDGLTNDEFEVAFAAAAGEAAAGEAAAGEAAAGEAAAGEAAAGEAAGEATAGEAVAGEAAAGEAVAGEAAAGEAAAGEASAGDAAEAERKAQELAEAERKAKEKAEADANAAIEAAKQEREKAEADAAAAALAKEKPTDEEEELLSNVTAVFPDVVKVLAVQERILTAKFENQLVKLSKDLEARFEQRIAPAEVVARQVARTTHEAEILKGHADAFDLLPKVEEWVGKQPLFLQNTYNAVLDKGTSAEIIALYDVFKKDTGSAHSHTPSPEKVAQQQADALKAEAGKAVRDKKLKSMEQVKGRQTAQKSGIDEDDFEAAFNAGANS